MTRRILVAGVGNIFLGDDGFGVEVARRFNGIALPPEVSVADFGIRGVHLAYQLLDGYDTLILIDTVDRRAAPGTLFVIAPELEDAAAAGFLDAHGLDPASVLGMLRQLGGRVEHVLVIGCQPGTLDEGIGLSAPVQRAVAEAVQLVRAHLDTLLHGAGERGADECGKEMGP